MHVASSGVIWTKYYNSLSSAGCLRDYKKPGSDGAIAQGWGGGDVQMIGVEDQMLGEIRSAVVLWELKIYDRIKIILSFAFKENVDNCTDSSSAGERTALGTEGTCVRDGLFFPSK